MIPGIASFKSNAHPIHTAKTTRDENNALAYPIGTIVSRDYPQLQVGIRMLRAGIGWIKTTDDGALLDLVKEERVIVRQALGLEPESDG